MVLFRELGWCQTAVGRLSQGLVYFPVAGKQYRDKINRSERGPLGSQFRKGRVHHWGRAAARVGMVMGSGCGPNTSAFRKPNEQEIGVDSKAPKPFSPVRFYLLKVPQLSQTTLPAGDHVFKHVSYKGHFIFKSWQTGSLTWCHSHWSRVHHRLRLGSEIRVMTGTGLQLVEPAGPYFSTCDMPEDKPEEELAKDNSKRKWLMTTVLDSHTQHAHEAQWPSFLGD